MIKSSSSTGRTTAAFDKRSLVAQHPNDGSKQNKRYQKVDPSYPPIGPANVPENNSTTEVYMAMI